MKEKNIVRRLMSFTIAAILVLGALAIIPATTVAADTLLTEDFENAAFPPTGWAVYNTVGTNHWYRDYVWHDTDYTHVAAVYWALGDTETWLVTPLISGSAYSNLQLVFNESGNYVSDMDYHGIWISTTGQDPNTYTFVELQSLSPPPDSYGWQQTTVDLSAYAGNDFYLAFRYDGNYADEWYIDDIEITGETGGGPSCPNEVWVDDDYTSSTPGWGYDHFDKIQDGVDAVCNGGTVHVAAGTYHEYLHIVKDDITLQGAGIDQTIIDLDGLIPYWHYAGVSTSYASRGGILITPYGQTAAGGNMPGGDPELIEDVTIKDLTVENAGVNPPLYATGTHTGSDNSATLVDSSQSWTPGELVGYWIHNMDDQGSGGIHAYGQITANTATTVTATLTGGTENDWDNGDHYIITTWEGFYDEDNDGRNDVVGIRVGSGKDVTIENCKVINSGDYGICFGRARRTDSGTRPPSENPIVRNCIVSDNHETGINVAGSTGTVTINNNIVSGNLNPDAPENHAKGICVAGRSNSLLLSGLIANNIVTGNRYYGIEAYRFTDGIIIDNNRVTGHNLHYDAAGIFVSTGWGFSKICRNNIVKNNIVTGNIRGIIAYYAWDCTFENNTVSTDSGTYEPGQAAIKIDHAYNIAVRNNIVSCDGLGIELTSSDTYNCLVTENTVDGAMFAGVYIRSGAY
ncbi:MAG: hypothetical protein DRN12_05610, partial [Thermoplasmata archaeon]